MKTTTALLGAIATTLSATAQVEIVDAGAVNGQVNITQAYVQNFDSLANSGTTLTPWVNNSTLLGWYAHQNSTGDLTSYRPNGPYQLTSLGGSGAIDRALGSGLDSGVGDAVSFGVRFVNSTSTTIGGFTAAFDGEQWFKNATSIGQSDSLVFSYQIFDANLGSFSVADSWVFVEELTFTSPINGGGAGFLDGNLPANRVADISSTIEGVVLASGQELWLRWTATNQESINDHGLGIDNLVVSFAAVPEPATYAALLGMSALLLSIVKRKRRQGPSGW